MNIEKILDQSIQTLEKKGSELTLSQVKEIKQNLFQVLKKDDPEESLKNIITNTKEEVEKFLDKEKNIIDGISACIYLPSETGEYKLKFLGGKTSNGKNATPITSETLFDIASITKMYTLLLVFSMLENHWLHLEDRIASIDPSFKNLTNYTIDDVIKMVGVIKTVERVDRAKTVEEAKKILATTYIEEYNPLVNNYTDIGFTILSIIIPKVIKEKTNQELSYEEIMQKYILEPFGLTSTMFHPTNRELAGNAGLKTVQDPKARILNGATGAAGIFTNADDLAKLAQKLYTVKYINYAQLMGTILFKNTRHENKGYAGIYQKHKEGIQKTFVPNIYSKGSFASQGYTGSIAIFDPNNKIHNSILVSSIKEGENQKPSGYSEACNTFILALTYNSIKAYLIQKYYNQIEKEAINIDKEITLTL